MSGEPFEAVRISRPVESVCLSHGLTSESPYVDTEATIDFVRGDTKWSVEVIVPIDLGILGETEAWVTINRFHFRHIARLADADTYREGERVVILDSEHAGEIGTVRATTDRYGNLEVAGDVSGLRRISAVHITRPRTMADPA